MKHCRYLLPLLVILPLLTACDSDDMDEDAIYTFTGHTIYSFCAETPHLQAFADIIQRSGQQTFFELYGHYTTFAPTDEAIDAYLREKGWDYDHLTTEQMQKIVYNSTIKSDDKAYLSEDFQEGSLASVSLSDRWVTISFATNEAGERVIHVNKNAAIVSLDNEVHNGVVHVVDRVVEPSEETLLNVLKEREEFSLWAQAYEASGLDQAMNDLYDPDYASPYLTDGIYIDGWYFKVCTRCKQGWTMFCEPDELLSTLGATDLPTLEQLVSTYYGTSHLGEYSHAENPLHKFVAYHILNRQMSTSNFLYTGEKTATTYQPKRYEWYETCLPNRLMEIKAGNQINTRRGGSYVGINNQASNIDAVNGFIHTLTDLLVYDEDVMRNDVLHKRLRFDVYALAPQLTNNNIRWQLTTLQGYNGYSMTPDFCGDYIHFSDVTNVKLWASDGWTCHHGDEMVFKGWYDVTFRMPPVPPGNWEIRLGYNAEDWRGIAQIFVDGQIAGIPKDLRINNGGTGPDPRVGYVADDQTPDNGVENDKLMRNHGYMKAPNSIYTPGRGISRDLFYCLRIIIGQYSFPEYAPHYFRAKNVHREDREFTADFLEYIPVDMIRDEDRE